MLKNKWFLAILSVIGIFVILSNVITRVFTKEIKLNASLETVNDELSDLKKIAKWHPLFKDLDTSALTFQNTNPQKISAANNSLEVNKKNGLESIFTIQSNHKTNNYIYSINVDTSNSIGVVLQYESSIWDKLFNSNAKNKMALNSLESLKQFSEDNKNTYGYKIERTRVVDTLFLFSSKTISITNKKQEIKLLLDKLIETAKQNNLGYNGSRIFYENKIDSSSCTIYCSVGINNVQPSITLPTDFSIKKMPKNGNLIFAFYQGPFKDINKAFDAVAKFKNNNNHVSMAIPFVKFLTEGTEFDDNQIIQAEVYHPVF